MHVSTYITPDELRAIHNCVCLSGEHIGDNTYMGSELNLAAKSLARMAHDIYMEWDALPDGSALKHLYADDVWAPEPDLPI